MNPNTGYYNQWPSAQPPNYRRFLPVSGNFPDTAPTPDGPQVAQSNTRQPFQHGGQIFPSPQAFPHALPHHQPQAPLVPLIPLSAVEGLQPSIPPTSGAFHDPFNRAYATSGPAVYEGFIPAPGREEDDTVFTDALRDPVFEYDDYGSSDEDNVYERMRAQLEEEEELRLLDERDDSEVDRDYSEEDAQHDEGDPDEMELGEDFEDWEEQTQRKKGRPSARLATSARPAPIAKPAPSPKDVPSARDARSAGNASSTGDAPSAGDVPSTGDVPSARGVSSTRGSRGRPRGRPRGRGRGGYRGSTSTRGRKTGKPGRPRGSKGPRAVADPGQEFRDLQRQANDRFIAEDYSGAIEWAQKAVQVNPEIFDSHNIISECYEALGDDELSIEALIVGAPTKRDPLIWSLIIDRINKLDTQKYPKYTDEVKTASVLACLNEIIKLNNNYEARAHKLEIEAQLGHVSKSVALGIKMLKTRWNENQDPDTEVLKTIAMMGTSSAKQTKIHLSNIVKSFEQAIEILTESNRSPVGSPLDWELINIYCDLLDRVGQYSEAVRRLAVLSRWKQGRSKETYWDEMDDDREFDLTDEPRRVEVSQFERGSENAEHGQTLPLEIRVKFGLFRLRKSADDFSEAMRHLEMLEPDNHDPDALFWDYQDLFRIVADALHATGHDKDALRFYEPLHANSSSELNLMSYIGLHTCYQHQGETDKAKEIIPLLQKWTAETYDELAVLAKFFEDQGMWKDAAERAETLYRDRYGQKLKKIGFKAYDELRAYHFQQRKQARGRYAVKKNIVKRNRKMMKTAIAQEDDDEEGDADGTGHKELPTLYRVSERPKEGLFRTKGAKPPKTQTFLPVKTTFEPADGTRPERSTLEGTDVPLQAIDHRLFRRKLENLTKDCAEELTAARAQQREIVCSFQRLGDISPAADEGDRDAINTVISITRELLEEFSTFDLFYANRREDLRTYFRRIGNGDIWKESALMVLAVVANNVEDGETDPEIEEKPEEAPEEFWGVHFDKWCDAFGRYAILLAGDGHDQQCFATLDVVIQSNVFHRSRKYHGQLQICRLACALAVDDSLQASSAVRWLLKEFSFGSDLFRLYSAVNRLCSFPDGFATGPAYKVLMRYIKTMDYALLTTSERAWYNFRDNKDNLSKIAGGGSIGAGEFPTTTTTSYQANAADATAHKVKDHDPALFALYAHVLSSSGSYTAALNYYFRALALTPRDPVLNLCIGAAYIQHAMKRLSENRQYQIQQGLAFIHRYYELRTADGIAIHTQEAEFNVGRMWHALGLMSLAIPAYEKCIAMRKRVRQEAADRCTDGEWGYEDFATEAAFAMQSIFATSGNVEGARRVTEMALVIE